MTERSGRWAAAGTGLLLLAACGRQQAPAAHEPFSDARGAHAGSFRAPGNDGDAAAAAADGNITSNAQ